MSRLSGGRLFAGGNAKGGMDVYSNDRGPGQHGPLYRSHERIVFPGEAAPLLGAPNAGFGPPAFASAGWLGDGAFPSGPFLQFPRQVLQQRLRIQGLAEPAIDRGVVAEVEALGRI